MRPPDFVAAPAAKPLVLRRNGRTSSSLDDLFAAKPTSQTLMDDAPNSAHKDLLEQLYVQPANRFTPVIGSELGPEGRAEAITKRDAPAKDLAAYQAAQTEDLRTQRIAGLEGNKPIAGKIKKHTDEMTQEDYDNLSTLQRAAVDFNTSLVRAVRRDKHHQDDYKDASPDERDAYSQSVSAMLGANSESTIYAPETVALLKQIDFKDDAAQLDDFLGLKVAIRAKDLKGIDEPVFTQVNRHKPSETTPATPETDKAVLIRVLADTTHDLQEKLDQGNKLLQGFGRNIATTYRGADVKAFGGTPTSATDPTSPFADSGSQKSYQQALGYILQHPEGRDEILNALRQDVGAGGLPEFFNFADSISKSPEQYKQVTGNLAGVAVKTPEEFRKLLKLGEPDG